MNDRISGLVLSEADYKETDVLLQVLTKEYGILSFVGKAAKKLSSHNHFLPMCLYEFMIDYKETKTIFTIHGSKLLENYFESSDIEMISFKNILTELTLKNREMATYDQLLFVFRNLKRENRYLLGSLYLNHLISLFGIAPVVDGCALCGKKQVVTFSKRHGGFLCNEHRGGEEPLPVERLKKIRLIVKGGLEHYEVLKDLDYDFTDFSLLMDFFLENADLYSRSYDFYRTLI